MKAYEKPMVRYIDIRLEERIAHNSNNCHAERGSTKSHGNPCAPAVLWSNSSKVVP